MISGRGVRALFHAGYNKARTEEKRVKVHSHTAALLAVYEAGVWEGAADADLALLHYLESQCEAYRTLAVKLVARATHEAGETPEWVTDVLHGREMK